MAKRQSAPRTPDARKWNHWKKSAAVSLRMRRRMSAGFSASTTSMLPESNLLLIFMTSPDSPVFAGPC
jgi:hypothetical protein